MASKKKQEDKHLQILRQLVAEQHNKKCFDCGQRGPTYVNMTIGAFVCTSCSGLLRGINPPHRVKSISMASFTASEIEFLQKHGNEVCRSIWLALWNSASPPEPESRDEQKLKDLISRKYERKMWYSSQPVVREPETQEPEVKPLKALLGESAPQVVMSSQKEQKSQRTASVSSLNKPAQVSTLKSSDLLGDLGSDPFGASTVTSTNSNQTFGIFNQPSTQDQFATLNSVTGYSAPPFDFFANSSGQSQHASDFFSSSQPINLSGTSNSVPVSDKYAAFSNTDLFKASDSHAGFNGSVFSSISSDNKGLGSQPNPFLSSGNASRLSNEHQQQQAKPNPFYSNSFSTQTQISNQNSSVQFSAKQIQESAHQGFQPNIQTLQQNQFLNQQNSSGFLNQPSGFGNQPTNFGNQLSNFGNQSAGYGNQSVGYGNQSAAYGNQSVAFGNQPTSFGSQTAAFGSQPAAFGSQPAAFGSQPAAFGNQPAVYQNSYKSQQTDLNVISQRNVFGSPQSNDFSSNNFAASGNIQINDAFGQSNQLNTWNNNQNIANQYTNTLHQSHQQTLFPGVSNNQAFHQGVNAPKGLQSNMNILQSHIPDNQLLQKQQTLNPSPIINYQNQAPSNQSNFSSFSNVPQQQQFWTQTQPASKSTNPFL
ncbi:arf-GAP domain and FG repeat-containing protein 1 isoform X1 [Hydra vulgaris]|uniref:arf-GAP domain and FG repeat-containing protein 1 isoform X1 n=1 Tax=Hydra vulgaris TaxID=6087 RepID=UPI001F5F8F90|nr:arf-GAP domain and FG repeat-containing protein 1 isoform X1 [Hydra vulgaris]